MNKKNLLAIYLNEFDIKFLKNGAKKFKCTNIQKFLRLQKCKTYSPDKVQDKNLDPWVQSVSINTGKRSSQHKIFKIGQKINASNIQIWDKLSKKNIKVIISPHGMLDPESFAINSWKKKIALFTYQGIVLKKANLIIVNSKKEKKNVQKKIKHPKITIIVHGIVIKKIKRKKNKDLINSVYFSKIHPIKNLLKLVQAWSFSKKLKNFKLSILGEIDDINYFNKINTIIKNSKNISFLGKIKKNKILNLSTYDVFILPSKSENFGLAVLEALNAGLYLILNKSLPWKNLTYNKFASLINFNSHNLENKILYIEKNKKYLLSKSLYNKKIKYLKSNHDWQTISKQYILEYKRLFF